MLTQIINGRILTPQGWVEGGSVLISDGKILEVTNSDLAVIEEDTILRKGHRKLLTQQSKPTLHTVRLRFSRH